MATVLLITETYLKSQTAVYDNVDVKDIQPHLVIAQDIEIQRLLGSDLYKEILAAVTGNSLTADHLELMEYIRPALAHYTVYYAYPAIWAKITNKGIQQKSGDYSQSVDIKGMQAMRNDVKNIAETYAQRLIDFLTLSPNAQTKYPAYWTNRMPLYPERKTAYNSGLYLGDVDNDYPKINPNWFK